MDKDLKGQVVVITGATSGFGKGVAIKLAERGANLALIARRENILDEFVLELTKSGIKAIAIPADISVLGELTAAANITVKEFQQIDVWINNAGGAAVGNFLDIPVEDHSRVISTDLMGVIEGSHFALSQFSKQNNRGLLINVASMLGKVPAPNYASYAAAKHGVVAFDSALRQELKAKEIKTIRVCTVMPMAMDTSFFEHALNFSGKETVPVPPLDDANKVIDAIVDLLSNPKDEVPVGMGSGVNTLLHNLLPAFSEALMGKITDEVQMKHAPDAPATTGNLRESTNQGVEIKDPKIAKK